MAVIIRDVSSLSLATKLDRNFCDPRTLAERIGKARIERVDTGQVVAADQLDQPGEPRADEDDIGGMKGQRQPLRGGLVAAIGFKCVVAQLRGKSRLCVCIGPELDVVNAAADALGVAGRSRCLFIFSFG